MSGSRGVWVAVCLLFASFAWAEDPPWATRLAAASRALGNGDAAGAEREWLEAEREIRAANDERALARVCFELGAFHAQAGRLSEAVTRFETALAIFERLTGPRHPDTLATLANLAAAQRDLGNRAEAKRLAERVRKNLEGRRLPADATLAQSLNTLGNISAESGEWADAAALYARVARIQNEEYRATAAEKRAVLENLAHAQERAGDALGASATLETLLTMAAESERAELRARLAAQQRKLAGAASLGHARLAELAHARGDDAAAETELGKVLADPSASGAALAGAGELAAALAQARAQRGESDAAKRLFGLAADALARAHGAEHPSVASARFNVGVLAYQVGDDAAARVEFEQALAIWRKTLAPDDAKRVQLEELIAELNAVVPDAGNTPDVGARHD